MPKYTVIVYYQLSDIEATDEHRALDVANEVFYNSDYEPSVEVIEEEDFDNE